MHLSSTLRAQVTRDFHRLAYNVKDPRDVAEIVFTLQDAVSGCLRDLMRSWNPTSGPQRLLEDVLARSIVFLPFRDRISATHVSRAWRATALVVPAIWSDIEISAAMSSPVDVLAMALARTGRHPIDIRVLGHRHNLLSPALLATLEPHVSRVRSLTWSGSPSPPASFLARPCPNLEYLLYEGSWSIGGNDFLGGRVGRLHTLDLSRFRPPAACAALATVTELSFGVLAAAWDSSPDYGLSGLFTLFPRLRSLAIARIAAEHVPILRVLRPPPSLAVLSLRSDDRTGGCNLLSLYEAWNSESLRDVQLTMPLTSYQALNHSSLLSHCLLLTLELFAGDRGVRVICVDCGGRKRSVALLTDSASERILSVCRSIFEAREYMMHLRSLKVSMGILVHMPHEPEGLALPSLKEVILLLEESPNTPSSAVYQWPWSVFNVCGAFTRSLALESVIVEMRCLSSARPPEFEDGRFLVRDCVQELIGSKPCDKPSIRVRGLPENVAVALSGDLQRLRIRCDVGTIVQATVP